MYVQSTKLLTSQSSWLFHNDSSLFPIFIVDGKHATLNLPFVPFHPSNNLPQNSTPSQSKGTPLMASLSWSHCCHASIHWIDVKVMSAISPSLPNVLPASLARWHDCRFQLLSIPSKQGALKRDDIFTSLRALMDHFQCSCTVGGRSYTIYNSQGKISNLVGFALVDRAMGLYTPCIFQVHIDSKHLDDKLHFERLWCNMDWKLSSTKVTTAYWW